MVRYFNKPVNTLLTKIFSLSLLFALCACGSGAATSESKAEDKAIAPTPSPTVDFSQQETKPIQNPPDEPFSKKLKPGEFTWNPERATKGPAVVVVSIPEQQAYVYRNGILIGRSTVSTGRAGHRTPTGVFHILEKQVKHFSSTYNNAPMPNMERLTWDGIALHAGNLPGYPASHGCVRLPLEFSRLLYTVTSKGSTVVIADKTSDPMETVHPGMLMPASVANAGDAELDAELNRYSYVWKPEKAPEGPLSLLISAADKKIYVYRNGILIGESRLAITSPDAPLHPGAYVMLDGYSELPSSFVPDSKARRWMAVGIPNKEGDLAVQDIRGRVKIPHKFAAEIYPILQPGDAVMITDLPATRQTTAHDKGFSVITVDEKVQGSNTTAKPKG